MKKIAILILLSFALFSCENHSGHRTPKSIKVKCYKQHNTTADEDETNDWIFWYIIENMDGGCSYYSSSTPVTNFSSVSWTKSQSLPEELNDKENLEQQPEEEIAVNDLSQEMQAEIDATPDNFGGMTYDEMGDYENSTQEGDNSTDGGNDGGSDGGGDSGGGDSGGGDGGGGDGGGGD